MPLDEDDLDSLDSMVIDTGQGELLAYYGGLYNALTEQHKKDLEASLLRYRVMIGFDSPQNENQLAIKERDLKNYARFLPEYPVLDQSLCASFLNAITGIGMESCFAFVFLR